MRMPLKKALQWVLLAVRETEKSSDLLDFLFLKKADLINLPIPVLVVAETRGVTYELNDWTVSDDNLIVRIGEVTAPEIEDLRLGNTARLLISAINEEGEAFEISDLSFSLRGSNRAIQELQSRCTGDEPLEGPRPQMTLQ